MNICIIPARGGSKRIPRKNIREFCGKPMIAWTIETALASGLFEHIVVSTDDCEIAGIASSLGADVPFVRPPDLANDHATTRSVVNHAIHEALGLWGPIHLVCCLYATAPLVRVADLSASLQSLVSSGRDFVFSVTSYSFPIQRALRMLPQGGVELVQPGHGLTRSQDLEPLYHDAGQFYWGYVQAFLQKKDMYSDRAMPFFLPRYRVQDIDTLEDWARAEWLMQALLAKESSAAKV